MSNLALEGDKWIRVLQKFDKSIVETLDAMGTEDLKARVLASQANLLESERKRRDDDDLSKAAAKYAGLKVPYDETKKFQTALINYGMLLLEERGVSLSDADEE